MPILPNQMAKTLVFTLLAIDAAFIGAHLVASAFLQSGESRLAEIAYGRLTIYSDTALPESFGFGKWSFAFVFSVLGFALSRQRGFLGLAAASAFLFMDDAGQFHESVGEEFVRMEVPGIFGLDAASTGELFGFALLGLGVLAALAFCWLTSGAMLRRTVLLVIVAIGGMFLSGVPFDILHNLIAGASQGWAITELSGVIEDGGEMIFMSLYVALIFGAFEEVRGARQA